jgi:hypothetical protein
LWVCDHTSGTPVGVEVHNGVWYNTRGCGTHQCTHIPIQGLGYRFPFDLISVWKPVSVSAGIPTVLGVLFGALSRGAIGAGRMSREGVATLFYATNLSKPIFIFYYEGTTICRKLCSFHWSSQKSCFLSISCLFYAKPDGLSL